MSESLFSRLFHYRESEKLSPRENYLTEMLAWMIGNLKQFGHDYVNFLMTKCENKTNFDSSKSYSVCVRTQVNVKYEEKDHFKNTTQQQFYIHCSRIMCNAIRINSLFHSHTYLRKIY